MTDVTAENIATVAQTFAGIKTMIKTIRVAKFRADMARNVLVMARDNKDTSVIAACIRVRKGWMTGQPVAIADHDLIAAFA